MRKLDIKDIEEINKHTGEFLSNLVGNILVRGGYKPTPQIKVLPEGKGIAVFMHPSETEAEAHELRAEAMAFLGRCEIHVMGSLITKQHQVTFMLHNPRHIDKPKGQSDG